MKAVKREMVKAKDRKDWRSFYGLLWAYNLLSKREAERLYRQKNMIIKLEGNYYEV